MATHTFPLDGEYVIKVKLLEINLGAIRGLEYRHELEITVDGERVLLAAGWWAGGLHRVLAERQNVVNSLAERLQVRVHVRGANGRSVVVFLQKPAAQGGIGCIFQRSTLIATDQPGLPHVENMTVTGPFHALQG